jgi:hypothetical protein
LADEAIKKDFGGIAILPTMFLVNREGIILKKYFGHIDHDPLAQDIRQTLGACRGINPKALSSFTFNILFLLYIL